MKFGEGLVMEGIQCESRLLNPKSPNMYADTTDREGSSEPSHILQLFPSDPPFMNFGATLSAMNSVWIDIFDMDPMNSVLNQAQKFPSNENNLQVSDSFNQAFQYDLCLGDYFNQKVEYDTCLKDEELRHPNFSGCPSTMNSWAQAQLNPTNGSVVAVEETDTSVSEGCNSSSGSDPHEAISYVLGYLGVNDLLSVERVCKSLCSAVRNDPFLWKDICINQPLNDRIDDNALIQIVSRAQGNLRSLCLFRCSRVTDRGLKQVLDTNPRLQKLSVPECSKLSVEGILAMLKDIQFSGGPGIKLLRVGRRYDVTQEHFKELKMILRVDESVLKPEPRYYHGEVPQFLPVDDDNRIIDIEVCPLCENLRLVYDCPICQKEWNSSQLCRACTFCISRCVECGRCVDNVEYIETFSFDDLCANCLKRPLKGGASYSHPIIEEEAKYQSECG